MDSNKDAQTGNGESSQKRQDSISDYNVFDDAKTYYSDSRHKANKATARTRTFSQVSTRTAAVTEYARLEACILTQAVFCRIVSCSRWRDWA